MLRRVAVVRTDVSEELSASFIGVTRIGELGTRLAVTSNRRTLRRNAHLHCNVMASIWTPAIVTGIKRQVKKTHHRTVSRLRICGYIPPLHHTLYSVALN
jgi:hypothetical protein